MDVSSLPNQLFVVGRATGGSGASIECCNDTGGKSGIYVWTTRSKAQAFSMTLPGPASIMEIDRDLHLWKWIDDIGLPYCIVDRGPADAALDIDPVPVERLPKELLLRLAGSHNQITLVLNVLRQQGAEQNHLDLVQQAAMMHPELKPGELLKRVQEMVDEQVQRDEETEVVMASLPPNTRRAMEKLIPQEACSKCGERDWSLQEVSRSGKAAKWKCQFCGRKTVVRDGEAGVGPAGHQRQAISKEVQREVWQRDRGRCVDCGSNESIEFDHVIPVSRGGSSTVRNIQLLCEPCNRRKSDTVG